MIRPNATRLDHIIMSQTIASEVPLHCPSFASLQLFVESNPFSDQVSLTARRNLCSEKILCNYLSHYYYLHSLETTLVPIRDTVAKYQAGPDQRTSNHLADQNVE